LNIINLLENNEWAEHCTGTVLGSLLESEITRLVSKEQPVPVVPDEWTIQDAVKFCRETGRQDAGSAMDAWNACRSAMLNGGKS
ncbi:molecular chaperone DnaJ, partial [Salmonella enterica]|nr:molecular chaperone DnaJ [Salmonella enterica]